MSAKFTHQFSVPPKEADTHRLAFGNNRHSAKGCVPNFPHMQQNRFAALWQYILQAMSKEDGALSPFFAILLPVLIGLAGLGVDSAMLYSTHSRLQAAVDAAALAGSLELPYDPDITNGKVAAAVRDYLDSNIKDARIVSLAQGKEARSVHLIAEVEAPMFLMPVLGLSEATVEAEAVAGFNNLEIVFVIDNSGSMRGAPIQQTNAAAIALVDLVMPEGMEASVKIGLVPFRGKVRIDSNVDGLPAGCRNADGTMNPALHEEYYKWQYRYPSYYDLRVSSRTCQSIPYTKELTQSRSSIVNAIEQQDARGSGSGTIISEGLKWARHVLTPAPPYTNASPDDDMRKIIILLTDGDTEDGNCGGRYRASYTPNNYWTNAYYGMLDMNSHCENGGKLNQYMLDEAAAAKAEGIEIFAVRFGSSDSTDVNLMQQVASSKAGTNDHYYDAPSAYDIDDIFKKIGRQLGWRLLH